MHHLAYFQHLRSKIGSSETLRADVDMVIVLDMVPHFWQEEAKSIPEWFIRYGRGLGFHVTWYSDTDKFVVRNTRSIADEETITWPGKEAA